MPFSISCKTISLFLLIFHTCANELNIFEPGTQVDTILSQDNNLAVSAGSTTATFEGITDDALQQHDQHPSDPNPLLLASENPDCAASSSKTTQSPAGRRRSRSRSKRDGGGNGGEACEWQEFKDNGPGTTTTPDDQQLRGKRRRPKPGYINPARGPAPLGPLNSPEPFTNLRPAPYKLDREPDPQKCPFGNQNIPVCYPKVARTQTNPALVLSPCRTVEPADPCDLGVEDPWCCREVYIRVSPNLDLVPLNMRAQVTEYNERYPNSASFCIGVLDPPNPPYPIWLWP